MPTINCPTCGNPVTVPLQEKRTGLYWGIGCLIAIPAILVVVAVFGLLAAIAVPSFVRARESSQYNACMNNVRRLDAAKDHYAIEHNLPTGATPTSNDISIYIEEGTASIRCPVGGDYTLNPVGVYPECSIHGGLN